MIYIFSLTFLTKIFKQIAKVKNFYGAHQYAHHLGFTPNILLYLPHMIYTLSLPSLPIGPSNMNLNNENNEKFLAAYIIKYEKKYAYANFLIIAKMKIQK